MLTILLIFIPISIILIPFFGKKRPKEVIKEFGVRSTPNQTYTVDDIYSAIVNFNNIWFRSYPEQKPAFIKMLKTTDLYWNVNRVSIGEYKSGLAKMDELGIIHIWIGPRLYTGDRKISYTGFYDQLAMLAMLSNSIEPNTNNPVVKELLREMKTKDI